MLTILPLTLGIVRPDTAKAREPKPVDLAVRFFETASTAEAEIARRRAANPPLTPKQAFASGAELGPPSGAGRADNQTKNIHAEITVNGKVVARLYNSGAAEFANEYAFLGDEIDFASDRKTGPDLAEDRADRISAVLQRHGAVLKDDMTSQAQFSAALAKSPVLEWRKAETALTQAAWLAEKAKQGPLYPGTLLSMRV